MDCTMDVNFGWNLPALAWTLWEFVFALQGKGVAEIRSQV